MTPQLLPQLAATATVPELPVVSWSTMVMYTILEDRDSKSDGLW